MAITPTNAQQKFLRLTRQGSYGVYQFVKYISKDDTITSSDAQELLTTLSEQYYENSQNLRGSADVSYANQVADLHNNTLNAANQTIIAALTT